MPLTLPTAEGHGLICSDDRYYSRQHKLVSAAQAGARPLALALTHGQNVQHIADDLGVSLNTVRTHVASAFSTTETSRQADLVRVVPRTVGPFGFG